MAASRALLSEAQVEQALLELNRDREQPWQLQDQCLYKEFHFQNFSQAFAFMTEVALLAEKADHHPDWSNSYAVVRISLTTHSVAGLTFKDVQLAQEIDGLV